MPRQVNRSRSTAVQVQQQSGGNPYSIVAPNDIRVSQDANRAAEALMGLTNLGNQLYTAHAIKKQEAEFRQGERDATVGKVDAKLVAKSEAYNKARDQVQAKASWAVDQTYFEQELSKLDLDNVDPDQGILLLNQKMDELFASQYEGENRANALEFLVPQMQAFRDKKNAEFAQIQQQKVEEQISADLSIATESDYRAYVQARSADPTVTFDYQALNDQIASLREGPAIPDEMFTILKDLAIKNGDPSLLLNLPDKWANGLDTFKHIPRFKDAYREAVFAAQRQADANESTLAKALKDQNEEIVRQAELGIAQAIMAGVDPQPLLDAYLSLPGAEGKDALSMDSSWRSARDDLEERDADFTKVAEIERDLALGTADMGTLFRAYGAGHLGSGKKGKQEFSRLVNVATEAMRMGKSDTNNRVNNYRDEVRTRFRPATLPGIPPKAADVQRQADALHHYNVLVFEQGVDALDALEQTVEKFDKGGKTTAGRQSNDITPQARVIDAATGRATVADLKANGVTVATIEDMVTNKQISAAEAQKLLAQW